MAQYDIKPIKNIKDEDILRGNFYWAAVPYSEARPFYIFKKDKLQGKSGRKVKENNAFTNSKVKSDIIDVIIRHKRRMVVVLQADDINADKHYPFVYVLPITTFNGDESKIEFIKNNNGDIIQYHYIGDITGKESVVNISDVKRIHKTLLLKKIKSEKLPDEVLEDVCIKLASYMDIQKLEKCDECLYNYENYMNSTQKQLETAVGQIEESLQQIASNDENKIKKFDTTK
ncbi:MULTISPECIES: type II toxin-antitoxin system PemK/MazF family toxin [unclassified Clostridium]|uniref:type II toxin-antitoxin system PemK/MazF family toxin n=1 Tax=unclassified Clostridium TaxID=2614128 RepID=UPI0025B9ED06|nr:MULTISPECIES: type II toxin-antitoxin system PemK/MazF family toxin [unclassified Clostridium]